MDEKTAILIATALAVAATTLYTQLPAISLWMNPPEQTEKLPRRKTEVPDGEEQLPSSGGEQVNLPNLATQAENLNREAGEIETARRDLKKLREDLSTSNSQNAELRQRCEALLSDLQGARLFLNTADTFADSDIIQALQKLNAEVQHAATVMVDRVINVFKLDPVTSNPEQQAVNRALESIGPTLVRFLRTAGRDDSESQVYLQIAFQAYLTNHLCRVVSSWTLDEERNAFIREVYQRLQDTENQAISGRWRSLTRVHTFPTCLSKPNTFVTPVVAGLCDILLVAGCTASQSDIMSELSSRFGDKILSAILLAGTANQMIGGVVSGDFEAFVVRPGETFRGDVMEDMDGSGETQGGADTAQTILCTSEMGLMKRVQLGKGEKVTKTVIKAKVLFESFLDTDDSD